MGQSKFNQEKYAEAEQLLKQAAALNIAGLDCRRVLAQTYLRQDKLQEAAAIYHELLRLTPNDVDVLVHQGLLLAQLGSTSEAKKHFQKALSIEPSHLKAAEYLLLVR